MNHHFTAWLVFMGVGWAGLWLFSVDESDILLPIIVGIAITVVSLLFEISGKLSKLLQSLKDRGD